MILIALVFWIYMYGWVRFHAEGIEKCLKLLRYHVLYQKNNPPLYTWHDITPKCFSVICFIYVSMCPRVCPNIPTLEPFFVYIYQAELCFLNWLPMSKKYRSWYHSSIITFTVKWLTNGQKEDIFVFPAKNSLLNLFKKCM